MKQFKIVFVAVFAGSESTSPKTDFNKTCTGIFSKFFFLLFLLCCRCHYARPYILRSRHQPQEGTQRDQSIFEDSSKSLPHPDIPQCLSEHRCTGSRPPGAGPAGSLSARRSSPSTWSACRWLISGTFRISATAPTRTASVTFPS